MVFKASKAQHDSDPILTNAIKADKVPWYKKPNLRYLYLFLFPTCMGIEVTSGFDSQMINAVQIVDAWNEYFNEPEGAIKGILAAIYSLGAICSLPFVPMINDRFGRRWSIFIGSAIMIFGAAIQAASQNIGMYLFARWSLGFGIPMCIVAGSAMLGELGYPKERAVLGGLFNSSYFVGAIVAAGITYGTTVIPSNWSWRTPSLLQAAPSLIQCSLVFMIPESPRWLISKDRREEALAILVKYHAEGDETSPIVQAEFAQIETTVRLEMENSKKSWLDMFNTSGNRRRLLVACLLGLFTQWSGNTLISYYLSDILEMIGYTDEAFKGQLNIGLTCWQLVNATILALVVPRLKRRPAYLTSVSLLLTVYISWTIAQERFLTTGSLAAGKYVIFVMFFYSPCYNIAYNALTYTYLVEIFPFAIRSRGITIFQLFGRGANFFNTFVNPIGLANATWKYLISYCVWLAFEGVCIYFLWPETSGRTLEELTFLFEKHELQEQQTMATEKQLVADHHDPHGPIEPVEKTGDDVRVESKETRVE